MEISQIKKIHTRHFDTIDQVHWGCSCGIDNCVIANLIDELEKSRAWKNDLNKGYGKATALYLEHIKKALSDIHSLEKEIIHLGSKP